ncbi:MAG: trigger factor [Bacillota bacterium]|nr:trigger factor [Bacillota bacterium]
MASVLEKKEDNVVMLTIDVTPEAFGEALQRSFRKNVNRFMIPGFRKGKAPMNLVTKYYGEGVLYEDAIDFAANPAYAAAVEEQGIEPVSQPEIDIVDIGREKGLKFTVTVTVKPEVTLGQYLEVEAVKPEFPVEDAAIEAELKRVQERNSRMIPVEDRPIQDGDTANIDYEGSVDGVPFEGGKGASYDLKIGSNTFIPGFEAQMIGHNSGESFDIQVQFPAEYGNEELAGKEATFAVTINSVKMTELPELDDEFAKDVSEFETLDAYKEDLRKKQETNAVNRANGIFEENVIKAVAANATVDIPHIMVDHEIEQMIEEQRNQMRYQGFELEQYLSYMGQTIDTFKEQMHEPAEDRVRTRLVLEKIAKEEAVAASEEEIEAEIEKMATTYNMKAEDIKSRITDEKDNFVTETIIRRKTVELLVAKAIPVAPPPELAEDPVEAKEVTGSDEVIVPEAEAATEPVAATDATQKD